MCTACVCTCLLCLHCPQPGGASGGRGRCLPAAGRQRAPSDRALPPSPEQLSQILPGMPHGELRGSATRAHVLRVPAPQLHRRGEVGRTFQAGRARAMVGREGTRLDTVEGGSGTWGVAGSGGLVCWGNFQGQGPPPTHPFPSLDHTAGPSHWPLGLHTWGFLCPPPRRSPGACGQDVLVRGCRVPPCIPSQGHRGRAVLWQPPWMPSPHLWLTCGVVPCWSP